MLRISTFRILWKPAFQDALFLLEKIRKITGLDLREFEHAITFKVALMVKKYLTSKPVKF